MVPMWTSYLNVESSRQMNVRRNRRRNGPQPTPRAAHIVAPRPATTPPAPPIPESMSTLRARAEELQRLLTFDADAAVDRYQSGEARGLVALARSRTEYAKMEVRLLKLGMTVRPEA